jgi:hypothetical protein
MRSRLARALSAIGVALACVLPAPARAQTRTGRLLVTVVDPMGAVVPEADVTITGVENATKPSSTATPVKTSDRGVATFERLPLGRYAVEAQFPGFDTGRLKNIRVRAGDNKQTVILPLRQVEDTITVGADAQEAASDRSSTFGTTLTREQLDSLSDDPDVLRQQLMDMAGPDAVISVDSFEGRDLPSKAQIKSIRISRDQFAAEIHSAGFPRIDVVTQPGVSPFRGSVGMNFYDSALDGRNPIIDSRAAAQSRTVNSSIGGTLIPNKLGGSIFFYGNQGYSTPVQYASAGGGAVSRTANLRTPNGLLEGGASLEYAVTRDQVLRLEAVHYGTNSDSLGAYDSDDRAYSTKNGQSYVYGQLIGPIGRRFAANTRFELGLSDRSSRSAVEAPTIVVPEAFTSGGAQRAGGTHSVSYSIGSDIDYVRGRHSVRMGMQLDGTNYRTDESTNYLGTYTFESLDAFLAGQPRSYTRRIGDPHIAYTNLTGGIYIQDDIRLRKNLTMTPGVRYEAQTHLADYDNFGPRFGVTWAPFASGRTTLRASVGIFYDWLGTSTYEQTLRVDGFRQQEINILDPSYPDPGDAAAPPTSRYLLDPNLRMARNSRVSTGISQMLNRRLTVNLTYAYIRGSNLLVGENLNAPVDGVRPDPTFANIVEAVSDGGARTHSLTTNVALNFAPIGVPMIPGAGRLIDWRRGLTVNGTYILSSAQNDTDGAFATPATNDLADEWGPAPGDVRHRANVSFNTGVFRSLSARFGVSANSALPLTIRTGSDDNLDLIFNDRPAGVGRNSARIGSRWQADASFYYAFALGSRQVNSGGGVAITGSSGNYSATIVGSQSVPRYRLNIGVNIQNLTNHANYSGYSGVMTSQFFLQPTVAYGMRRVTFNASVSF